MSLDDLFEILDCYVETNNIWCSNSNINSITAPYTLTYNGKICTSTTTGNIE